MGDHVRYHDWDELFERMLVTVPDSKRRSIAARRLWLQWIGKLRRAVTSAEAESWSKSEFGADKMNRKLQGVLAQFCKGRIPVPKSEGKNGRFDSLFEIIAPPSPPAAYPTSLAYTGIPVGSSHGVGISPSASSVDPARYENYVDGPVIKSRKRGKGGHVTIGSGKVVQSVNK